MEVHTNERIVEHLKTLIAAIGKLQEDLNELKAEVRQIKSDVHTTGKGVCPHLCLTREPGALESRHDPFCGFALWGIAVVGGVIYTTDFAARTWYIVPVAHLELLPLSVAPTSGHIWKSK